MGVHKSKVFNRRRSPAPSSCSDVATAASAIAGTERLAVEDHRHTVLDIYIKVSPPLSPEQ